MPEVLCTVMARLTEVLSNNPAVGEMLGQLFAALSEFFGCGVV